MTVRLRESAPGVYRLDHDAGEHDDRAVSLWLAALALMERSDSGNDGGASNPNEIAAQMGITREGAGRPGTPGAAPYSPYTSRPIRGPIAAVLAAQRAQTPAQRRAGIGLVVPGSANDH
jgi:hypothetical protein